MEAFFTNKDLEKLYTTGKSRKYPLQTDIARKFVMCVTKIMAAETIHDFWQDPALNFEKLRGPKHHYSFTPHIHDSTYDFCKNFKTFLHCYASRLY